MNTLPVERRPTSVAILGFFGNRAEAPLDDPSFEIWGLNQLYQVYSDELRWDRWFEMHALDFLKKWNPPYVEWLKAQPAGRPIYMQEHHDEIPASVRYPRQEVNDFLSKSFGFSYDYFTSTFSYQMALALYDRFSTIGIYGMGLVEDGECYFERSGLEYLIGIAQGSGVRVLLESGSPLLKIHYVYGYSEPRMKLTDVLPVCDFLKQSAAMIADQKRELVKLFDASEDVQQRGELALAIAERRAQGSMLRDTITWLKHYGRGGALIAPDGRLNE